MKFTDFQRKSVSLIVLISFVTLLQLWATPAPAATRTGNSETTIAQGNSGGPNFIEEESGSTRSIQKAKKFPWLFVGLGVIAIGVAVYFLVIKKTNYTLTVTLGAGCTGTPAATTSYEKGTVVSYNYTPMVGYGNVQVTVDGVAAPASGTITMDKDKALTVTAELLDIRGTWNMLRTNTGSSPVNRILIFTGTTTSGTVSIQWSSGGNDAGVYTVNGSSVDFTQYYPSDPDMYEYHYVGSFSNKDTLSGTFSMNKGSLGSGTWTASRTSSTTTYATALPGTNQSELEIRK
jgi:hypothetical protein